MDNIDAAIRSEMAINHVKECFVKYPSEIAACVASTLRYGAGEKHPFRKVL